MNFGKYIDKLDKAIESLVVNKQFSSTYKKVHNEFENNRVDIAIYNNCVSLMDLLDNELSKLFAPKNKQEQAEFKLKIAATSLVMACVGKFFSPTLSILSAVGIGYVTIHKFRKTWQDLQQYKITVDLLGATMISVCLLSGYYVVAGFACTSYSIAHLLLEKIKDQSRKEVIEIFRECPTFVWLVKDGVEIRIPFEKLVVGDVIVVQAGEVIPADGTISGGIASIDQHILTGESQPAEKQIGDPVFASTVVLSGKIHIRVENAGENTIVAKIGQILNNTAGYQTSQELRAQEITNKTVIPTFLLAGASLPFLGAYKSTAILNAHFKHRMTILSPVSILSHLKLFSNQGILIKDGHSLDLLTQVDTMVFDKTGTLTQEQPSIAKIYNLGNYSENEILTYAAAAEQKQSHPIAQAILNEAQNRGLEILPIDDSECKIGYGVTVKVQGKLIRIGSNHFMKLCKIQLPSNIAELQAECHQKGHSVIMIAGNLELIGAIELRPTIRPNAKQVITALKKEYGIKECYIISGDHEAPTRHLANRLGMDHYFAETLPEDKANIIKQLQDKGKFICYIGDGINDSIALKQSQVSISLKGASSVAQDTAQIILMEARLDQLVYLFKIAKDFQRNINQCFIYVGSSTIIGMLSVFFLNMGLITTVIVGHSSLAAGLWTATKPLRENKKNSQTILKETQDVDNIINKI